MHEILTTFANWIATTRLSLFFQTTEGVVATLRSIHILAVSVVFGSALVISLRLLCVGASGRTVSRLVSTVLPWMYRAVVALLLTGPLQIIAEPVRQLRITAFSLKMGMLVCVLVLTAWFGRTMRASAVA